MFVHRLAIGLAAVAMLLAAGTSSAQSSNTPADRNASKPASTAVPNPVSAAPSDYLIGPDDVLFVSFWRDKELSTEAVVRPDGKISLQLINDVQAAGLTPEQLRAAVTAAAAKYVEDPTVTVVVKQINSRKVYIVGQVNKPGIYPLGGPMTVIQLIALAGGLTEFADRENLAVVSVPSRPDAEPSSVRVNYAELLRRKNLKQNIVLKPGDTVVVP
jgi:polysaccharide export outer membrane protein